MRDVGGGQGTRDRAGPVDGASPNPDTCGNDTELDVGCGQGPEIVPVPALFLAPVPDTVFAVCLSLRSGAGEVREIVLVPVPVLVP